MYILHPGAAREGLFQTPLHKMSPRPLDRPLSLEFKHREARKASVKKKVAIWAARRKKFKAKLPSGRRGKKVPSKLIFAQT